MRPVERIEPMVENLTALVRTYWTRSPDMRLPQVLMHIAYENFGTTDLGYVGHIPDDEFDAQLSPPAHPTHCKTCGRDLYIAPYHFVSNECPECFCARMGIPRG